MNGQRQAWSRFRMANLVLPALGVLVLAGCATVPSNLPPKQELDASGQPIINAPDVAIAGQLAAHSILDLPEVAQAQVPPLVRFTGVTSVVNGPVDPTPYTTLLRDRLLLITREKLRFVERQLPPLTSHHVKHSKDVGGPLDVSTDADYRIVAQLRGNFGDDTYYLLIQFVDLHGGQPLFSGDYRIHKEEQNEQGPEAVPTAQNPNIESTEPNPVPPPAPRPPIDSDSPSYPPSSNSGLQ